MTSTIIGRASPRGIRMPYPWATLATLIALGLSVLFPLALLLFNSFNVAEIGAPAGFGLANWEKALLDEAIWSSFWTTILIAAIQMPICSALAVFFAWLVTRTDMPGKGFVTLVMWLGFFLPSLSMVVGWILLLDPNAGFVNTLWRALFGTTGPLLDVYSIWGIVLAHVAPSTSVRFLLLVPAFQYMSSELEDAAYSSGYGLFRTLLLITVPLMLPAVLAVSILGFIHSLASFEIEYVLGVPAGVSVFSTTLHELMLHEPPQIGVAAALGCFMLAVILTLFWAERILLGRRSYATVSGKPGAQRLSRLGRARPAVLAFVLAFSLVMIVLPFVTLVFGTFMKLFGFWTFGDPLTVGHWVEILRDPSFAGALRNTVIIAGSVAILGAFIHYGIARIARASDRLGTLCQSLARVTWMAPGLLFGLALYWTIVALADVVPLYGTLVPIIFAVIVYQMPLGTQIFGALFRNIDGSLEEAARLTGVGRARIVVEILLPLAKPAIISVAIILFVLASREVPLILYMTTGSTRPLSILMLEQIAGGSLERACVLGVILSALVLAVAALIPLLARKTTR